MKKLCFCTLSAAALFVTLGVFTLFSLAPRPRPFGLLFPLLWDLVMVGIGLGIIFRCEVARKAGLIWSVFCIVASIAVGIGSFMWIEPQYPLSVGVRRITFMSVSVAFGVLFGAWQLIVLRNPDALPWSSRPAPPPRMANMGRTSRT